MLISGEKTLKSAEQKRCVTCRNNLPEIKDRAYVINLDEYKSTEIYWIAFYVIGQNTTNFSSFRFQNIVKEIKKFIGKKDFNIK